MESLIIPGILGAITVVCFIFLRNSWDFDIVPWLLLILTICAFICCLTSWTLYRADAIEAEAYYENIVQPHIVQEYDEYVVVGTDIAPAIWQAGESNLATYNGYLKSTRYWDSIPVIGTIIYPPPDKLKFVRVQNAPDR